MITQFLTKYWPHLLTLLTGGGVVELIRWLRDRKRLLSETAKIDAETVKAAAEARKIKADSDKTSLDAALALVNMITEQFERTLRQGQENQAKFEQALAKLESKNIELGEKAALIRELQIEREAHLERIQRLEDNDRRNQQTIADLKKHVETTEGIARAAHLQLQDIGRKVDTFMRTVEGFMPTIGEIGALKELIEKNFPSVAE